MFRNPEYMCAAIAGLSFVCVFIQLVMLAEFRFWNQVLATAALMLSNYYALSLSCRDFLVLHQVYKDEKYRNEWPLTLLLLTVSESSLGVCCWLLLLKGDIFITFPICKQGLVFVDKCLKNWSSKFIFLRAAKSCYALYSLKWILCTTYCSDHRI